MFWRQNNKVAALALITIQAGCARPANVDGAGTELSTRPASEDIQADVFRAAVTILLDSLSSSQSVYVDPGPVLIENAIRYPDVSSYREGFDDVRSLRLSILRTLGADTTTSFPVRSGCTGPLVPPGFKRTDECPADYRGELAFDVVRRKGMTGQYSVRVMHIFYTPSDRSAVISDMHFVSTGSRIAHLRTDLLVFID
jgi:hypothetical protein